MKKGPSYFLVLPLLVLCVLMQFKAVSQTPGEWTWMAGSATSDLPVYGTQGVPAMGNTPPNPNTASHWVDLDGNLWLYGGFTGVGVTGTEYQDMWKYDVTNNTWIWMSGPGNNVSVASNFGTIGSFSPTSRPRGSWGLWHSGQTVTWVTPNGDLWMTIYDIIPTGQFSSATGSSTWKYSTTLNQWACMHKGGYNLGTMGIPAATNSPQPAYSQTAWVSDDGNLWLYESWSGKMWSFNTTTNMWTYQCGSISATAVVGTIGVYSPNNQPENKKFFQHWKSDDGTFYCLGTTDFQPNSNTVTMWQFDPTIEQWRVVAAFPSNSPSFTQDCTFDPANCPSTVFLQTPCWKDECNRFYGIDEAGGGYIWCFDPAINQFAKVSGTISPYGAVIPPNYGTQGVSSPTNFPGTVFTNLPGWNTFSGTFAPSWTDHNGNFWLMGSNVYESNPLWRYVPDQLCIGGPVNAFFSASSTAGCAPHTIDFESVHPDNILDFSWDFGDALVTTDTSSQSSPSYTFTEAGTYIVTLIVSGVPGCGSATDTMEMEINIGDLSQMTVTPDTTICPGESVDLTATGANSYSWTPSIGLSGTSGAVVTASPTTTTTYFVTGEFATCSAGDTVQVTLAGTPQLNVSDTIVCEGSSVAVSVSGADFYSWSPSTGLSSTTGSTVNASPVITTMYTVTGTDSQSGCEVSESLTVSVEHVSVNVNSGTLCENDLGASVMLTASGADSYHWSPAIGLNDTIGSSVQSSVTQTITYTVVGSTVSGCVDSVEAVVTVIPDFEITVNSEEICEGQSVLLTANGADYYDWSPATGLNATTGTQVTSSPTTTTNYAVVGSTNGCLDTAYALVTIYPNPIATISANPNPVSSSDPVVVLSTDAQGNSVQWFYENELISNLEDYAYVLNNEEPGNYSVQLVLTNDLGCTDTANLTLIIEEDIVFYVPNAFTPEGDEFNPVFQPIMTSGIDPTSYTLQIFNRWGALVFETNDINDFWDGTFKGEICPDGTYTWKIRFGSKYNGDYFEYVGHVSLLR